MGPQVDMRSTTKTRVQRRIEKKQAVLLVALVLAVSVISFVLGVVVGQQRGEATVVQQVLEPQRILVDEKTPAPVSPEIPATEPVDEQLTFYDNLSKDVLAPIGSGINLPPDADPVKVVAEVTVSDVVTAPIGAVKETSSAPATTTTPISSPVPATVVDADMLPEVDKRGTWVVQVFSSKSAADAGLLRDKLSGKGYSAFITEADLGGKGIWYRVLLGPYVDKATAVQAQAYAGKKDKLTGFAKRR